MGSSCRNYGYKPPHVLLMQKKLPQHPKASINRCCSGNHWDTVIPRRGRWQSSCCCVDGSSTTPLEVVTTLQTAEHASITEQARASNYCCTLGPPGLGESSRSGQQSPHREFAWLQIYGITLVKCRTKALYQSTFLKTNSDENYVWWSVCLPTYLAAWIRKTLTYLFLNIACLFLFSMPTH